MQLSPINSKSLDINSPINRLDATLYLVIFAWALKSDKLSSDFNTYYEADILRFYQSKINIPSLFKRVTTNNVFDFANLKDDAHLYIKDSLPLIRSLCSQLDNAVTANNNNFDSALFVIINQIDAAYIQWLTSQRSWLQRIRQKSHILYVGIVVYFYLLVFCFVFFTYFGFADPGDKYINATFFDRLLFALAVGTLVTVIVGLLGAFICILPFSLYTFAKWVFYNPISITQTSTKIVRRP